MNGREQVFTVSPTILVITALSCNKVQPMNSKALKYIQK